MSEKYDVVVDTLQKQHDKLWEMTRRNIEHNSFNIMDDIRLRHMEELKSAIECWKNHKNEYVEDENDE